MSAIVYPMHIVFDRNDAAKSAKTEKSPKIFSEFVAEYLEKSKRSKRYKEAYENTMMHVEAYRRITKIDELYTDNIGAEFYEGFVDYLRMRSLMQNTIRGHIEKLNAMLHKSALYGYPINNTYLEVKVAEEEVDNVFLTMTEITRIYYYEGLTRFQEAIRDYFIIGCLTGLRYSDYSRLNETNFIRESNQIRIKAQKTGTPVLVPMHRFVREILQKYDYKLPQARCVQHFNKYMKEICRKVGFTEPVLYERIIGMNTVSRTVEKWELIGSHTARRSFATNAFLAGIPVYRIMLITGHKSEKNFFKYVRITREENALTLSSHHFFQ